MPSILRLIRSAAMLVAILLLAACTLRSEVPLVLESEAVQPLPASFVMFPYDDSPEGYTPEKDAPGTFTLVGSGYVNDDSGPKLTFLPTGEDGVYLLSAGGDDGETLYGIARFVDGLLAVHMVFDSKQAEAAISAITVSAPKAIAADLVYSASSLTISRRETLDYLVPFMIDGTLPTLPMVAWLGDSRDATPPPLVRMVGMWPEVAD